MPWQPGPGSAVVGECECEWVTEYNIYNCPARVYCCTTERHTALAAAWLCGCACACGNGSGRAFFFVGKPTSPSSLSHRHSLFSENSKRKIITPIVISFTFSSLLSGSLSLGNWKWTSSPQASRSHFGYWWYRNDVHVTDSLVSSQLYSIMDRMGTFLLKT